MTFYMLTHFWIRSVDPLQPLQRPSLKRGPRRAAVIATTVLVCLFRISPVAAEPRADDQVTFAERPLALGLVLGVATPTGEIGVTAEYSIVPAFAFGLGAGTSFVGTQLAASGRIRLARREGAGAAHAFDLVLALSTGRYQGGLFVGGDSGNWDERAYWAQFSFDYELLRWTHLRFATGIGLALLLGSSDAKEICVDYCPKAPRDVWPTTHITVGFAP